MSVTIEPCQNGYLVYGDNGETEDGDSGHEVFEANDTGTGEVEALGRALLAIVSRLGMLGTKHDPARIKIIVEPGGDYQGGES